MASESQFEMFWLVNTHKLLVTIASVATH